MIDDLGTPMGVQQKLMRHADVRTIMNIYGWDFEETKRRVNARVAGPQRTDSSCHVSLVFSPGIYIRSITRSRGFARRLIRVVTASSAYSWRLPNVCAVIKKAAARDLLAFLGIQGDPRFSNLSALNCYR